MKLREGMLIQWQTVIKNYTGEEQTVGIVTKKASRGYWVLWSDGTHKILPKDLTKYARVL